MVLLAGALLVWAPSDPSDSEQPTRSAAGWRGVASEAFGGFRSWSRSRGHARCLGCSGQRVLGGALDVLLVVLALDLLVIGEAGVGYLNAAIGAGGLVGAAMSVPLIGRARLAPPLRAGIGLWALPS